jgi:hypothetical protein
MLLALFADERVDEVSQILGAVAIAAVGIVPLTAGEENVILNGVVYQRLGFVVLGDHGDRNDFLPPFGEVHAGVVTIVSCKRRSADG